MYEILVADKERVDAIFQEFSESNEDGALGISLLRSI